MTTRSLKSSDIPILKEWAESSGFEYPEPNDINIEKLLVVADDEDRPIVAFGARRLVEGFGWFSPIAGAELRNEALGLLVGPMNDALKRLGYDHIEVTPPPNLTRRGVGSYLERIGWHKNWTSWGRRIL